jgi:amylosucrase
VPPVLPALDARARTALAGLDPVRADAFLNRLHRWGADLLEGLAVYRAPDAPATPTTHGGTDDRSGGGDGGAVLAQRVLDLIARAFAARRPALLALDERRLLQPDWFATPQQVGYVCYADRFAGTLAGVGKRIDYLRELGVSYLHLMPLLQPRDGADDGGYAVADYRRVRPDLGTVADLAELADALHENGIALTLDLVLNHVAREHAWARAAVAGDPHYQRYFHAFADRTEPDGYERTLPEVFPDLAPGNFSWVPDWVRTAGDGTPTGRRGAWVWTTFHDYQWDLDWSNADVFCELLDVVLSLANVGVDCLRLDAIAFLWKRLGTSCQNLPEVHLIVQALRAAVRIAAPAVIFKAEAIVAPEDLPAYLGRGPHAGRVCDLAYHNSLMVQLWSALASGRADLAERALAVPPPKPVTTAWGTYVRCHDDIGWAVSDSDAAAVGLSGPGHRAWLADFFAGRVPGSFARGEDFQVDPRTGDRRTCGSLASLAGLEVGLEQLAATGDSSGVDRALGRIFLLHAVIYGYGGIPLLYMGDELGLRNDHGHLADPRLAGDNRWLHRPAMPWDVADRRHDPATLEGRIFAGLVHLARVRAGLPSLHAAVESQPFDVGVPGVLGLQRRHPAGVLVQLYNVTADWQHLPAWTLRGIGLHRPWDHISGFAPHREGIPAREDASWVGGPADGGWYALPPYAAWWLGEHTPGT